MNKIILLLTMLSQQIVFCADALVYWNKIDNAKEYVVTCTTADTGFSVAHTTELNKFKIENLNVNKKYIVTVKPIDYNGQAGEASKPIEIYHVISPKTNILDVPKVRYKIL